MDDRGPQLQRGPGGLTTPRSLNQLVAQGAGQAGYLSVWTPRGGEESRRAEFLSLEFCKMMNNALLQQPSALMLLPCRPILTSVALNANFVSWKSRTKYTIAPVKMRKSGGRDHTGRIRVHGIGGGHKQRYRMIDFLRFRPEETKSGPFEEKVIQVRYDPCRSADIALVAGGSRKRWIIATENMQAGDTVLNSNHIGRMAGERWLPDVWAGGSKGSRANEILSFSCCSGRGCASSWGSACGDPHQQRGK
ncbi:PREDICTED: 39S ribosomal protein L2, mitochondrial isoform X2 [Cercocebus atys]|uniref:39S ribosomal protein L2, mitochondrial isoform X2 n=1 Tax=Cercocebus atys TaxID=9531 RepID=UPI0005F4B0D1|nr:PREDICTED: 39S ribosomal protein L2, mitochondrial isoform X2 [Cercocebus atys]